MLRSREEFDQDNPLGGLPDKLDPVTVIRQAMSAGESPIIAVEPTKSARAQLLDQLGQVLRRENFRVLQAMSLDGAEINLTSLMNQVLGEDCDDATERSERFFALLMEPEVTETRLTLIIDDAHLLTDQTFRYLELIIMVARVNPEPLQIILIGGPELWDRLPPTGNLAANKAAPRSVPADEVVGPKPEADRPEGPTPGVTEMEPAANPTAAGPVTAEAPLAEVPGSDDVLANEVEPPVQGESSLADQPLESAKQVGVRPRQSKRSRLALAASVCIIVVSGGGGLTTGGGLNEPRGLRNVTQLMAPDQLRRSLGQFEPMPSFDVTRSAAVTTAVSVAATPDAVSPTPASFAGSAAAAEQPKVTEQETAHLVPVPLPSDAPPKDVPHRDALAVTSPPEAIAASQQMNPPDSAVPAGAQELLGVTMTPATETTVSAGPSEQASPRPVSPSAAAVQPVAPTDVTTTSATPDAQPPVAPSNTVATVGLADQPVRVVPTAITPVPVFKPESAPDRTASSVAAPDATASGAPDAGMKVADANAHPLPNLTEPPTQAATTSVSPAVLERAPATSGEVVSQQFSPSVVALLIARGDALLETGDVAAARLMYERAAGANSAQAAIAMGMTYDSRFLAQIGARGIVSEKQRAIVWYQLAADLGRPEGMQLLTSLQAGDGK